MTDIESNQGRTEINIYPNPTNGKFSVDLGKEFEEADITITELDGREVLKKQINNSHIIDLELSSKPGIYLIHIESSSSLAVIKIIKN